MTRSTPGWVVQPVRGFVPEPTQAYACAHVYPSVFTARQCDRIVEQARSLAPEVAEVGTTGADVAPDDAVRRSHITWLGHDGATEWIVDKLATVVARANRSYGFDLIGFTEDLQLTTYDGSGAFYTWHQDGLDGELAIRKLSLVVQLTDPDDYDGGDLELFGFHDDVDEPELRAQRRGRGTVVVFPSFEFHRVTPMVSGTRRSLVCWVGGPPFR